MQLDINCDLGESFGNYQIGNDEELIPLIDSANIACGFHAGDPVHIKRTIALALKHNLRIGAHPGYPDLNGFGRRPIKLNNEELEACILYQVAALKGMVEALGGKLSYVKPHGALYNHIASDASDAKIVIRAIQKTDKDLQVMGLAGSNVGPICKELNAPFIAEAFADRRYEADGSLRSRQLDKALILDASTAAQQVYSIWQSGVSYSLDGTAVNIMADSFCIHGDNPSAVDIVTAIKKLK